jgi:valyl-tRNA synthetase
LVPLKGIIDVTAERTRLDKKLTGLSGDLAKSRAKLDNPNFLNNAPADVVTLETKRAAVFEDQIAKLQEQLEKLENLA